MPATYLSLQEVANKERLENRQISFLNLTSDQRTEELVKRERIDGARLAAEILARRHPAGSNVD